MGQPCSDRRARRCEARPLIVFERSVAADPQFAASREWIVTNGIGGYASGTIDGSLTRRYHGLLVAALAPPLGRTLLLAKVDEVVAYGGVRYALSTNRWHDGTIDPHGAAYIERFALDGTTPVWTFALADAIVEKRITMALGANASFVEYRVVRARGPLALEVKALADYRDYHATTRADERRFAVEALSDGVSVRAEAGTQPFSIRSSAGSVQPEHIWYRNYDLPRERERGLDDCEDHLLVASFAANLASGEPFALSVSTDDGVATSAALAFADRTRHEAGLLRAWRIAQPSASAQAPPSIAQLVLAADQFVVARPLPGDPDAHSTIAGYHWFGDWGRDTMIALPGLTLTTGRTEIARRIVRTWAQYVDGGMLPNRFPDAGTPPEYNSVDAALWFVRAVDACTAGDDGRDLLRELFAAVTAILTAYDHGTRFGIHVDPADGLLVAGEPGVQLTWMDAKVGDCVVSPRIGKPVEVNALWYDAVCTAAEFADRLGEDAAWFRARAARVRASFDRFWCDATQTCYDVIDGPDGPDASIRPNGLFAVALPHRALSPERERAIVDRCVRELATPVGVRSLAPNDPRYRGEYCGGLAERDGAYHEGTAWGWLLGPLALAEYRVSGDPVAARSRLEPMLAMLAAYGIGTLGEISDGDAPFAPRGCIAQAWTVGEILRVWHLLCAPDEGARTPVKKGTV